MYSLPGRSPTLTAPAYLGPAAGMPRRRLSLRRALQHALASGALIVACDQHYGGDSACPGSISVMVRAGSPSCSICQQQGYRSPSTAPCYGNPYVPDPPYEGCLVRPPTFVCDGGNLDAGDGSGPGDAGDGRTPDQSDAGDGGLCTPSYEITCFLSIELPSGRRPSSLLDDPRCDNHTTGKILAELARLEAASVTAFRILARELRDHRAPKYLVMASERAAHEEIGHARMVGTLARRYGEAPRAAVLAPAPPTRHLEEIALENAVEGCARETFGAVLAQWQARHATDPAVRRAMAVIGVEEAGHAELAWKVTEWAEQRLPRGSRRRVVEARERELTQLQMPDQLIPSRSLAALGLPCSEVAAHLAAELAAFA
jgi:hypothetical protein